MENRISPAAMPCKNCAFCLSVPNSISAGPTVLTVTTSIEVAVVRQTSADTATRPTRYPTTAGIATLTRAFYGRLVSDTLSYWLDRMLAAHVGRDARFASAADRAAFDAALTQYVSETTRIIKEFSSGLYGKHVIGAGRLDGSAAAAFGVIALKKILSELRERQADNA